MIQALRAAVFLVLLIAGGLQITSSAVATGIVTYAAAFAWNQWVMEDFDGDYLAALMFFVFVLYIIASILITVIDYLWSL